jgi:hypothetical protein
MSPDNTSNGWLRKKWVFAKGGQYLMKGALDRMLAVDYIICNEDRHWNNFGLVRYADTLEWLGFAPVYDSGTSLWYDKRVGAKVQCKPFRKDHAEQIKLVVN